MSATTTIPEQARRRRQLQAPIWQTSTKTTIPAMQWRSDTIRTTTPRMRICLETTRFTIPPSDDIRLESRRQLQTTRTWPATKFTTLDTRLRLERKITTDTSRWPLTKTTAPDTIIEIKRQKSQGLWSVSGQSACKLFMPRWYLPQRQTHCKIYAENSGYCSQSSPMPIYIRPRKDFADWRKASCCFCQVQEVWAFCYR